MTAIVNGSCSTEGCHGATGMVSANLVLTHDTITDGSHFIDKPAQGGDGNTECPLAGFKLINQAMPEESLIYQKLSRDACGEQMPETNPKLTTDEKACVLDWIKYLIAQNGKVGG